MTVQNFSCIESRIDGPKTIYARYKIGPFFSNQTLTVANNLRRTLLSDLDGIAFVAVKIQGVQHEYAYLPGIRESVFDILLNIKQIALSSAFKIHSPHVAYLQASGPGVVKAADIQLPVFLKCVDPDQAIATLSNNAQLQILFLVCPGKNYWLQSPSQQLANLWENIFSKYSMTKSIPRFDDNWQTEKTNLLPIDAMFMPIERVNYTIENDSNLTTEQPSEFIYLEVWTNGSIHPTNAIELAATSLVELFKPFQRLQSNQFKWTRFRFNSKKFGNSKMFTTQKFFSKKSIQNHSKFSALLDLDIGNLNLSLRPYTCLKRANIQTIRDLLSYSREELLLFKNFGQKSLEEVENSLFQLGFFFKS